MSCFECATVVSRWRVWVFLSLNLLLLAILFTSTSQSQSPSNETVQETQETAEKLIKNERKKKQYLYEPLISASDEDHVVEKECNQLSNEELNRRVEAFIAMFRQQYLVSDAKVKSCGMRSPSKGISCYIPLLSYMLAHGIQVNVAL
ncbi:uncharacterized protein Fot_21379 [Forsythia ovata]|uniref:Uncharacterized protein n=1 Tax=Forsythia ovata TaxID=205694 RepID=A0ABD1UUM6_9LAMI